MEFEMKKFKIIGKTFGKTLGKTALQHVTNKDTYTVMGAVGLGGLIGSKDPIKGVEYALIAALGMFGYTYMKNVPEVVDEVLAKAIENGDI